MHGNRLPTQRASAEVERVVPCAVALAEAAQRVGNVTPAQPPDICASGEEYGIVFEEADPPLCGLLLLQLLVYLREGVDGKFQIFA